jgi:hypothetical protein
LPTKPENGGMPARLRAGGRNSSDGDRPVVPQQAADPVERRCPRPLDQAADEEQRGLHHDVVDDVEMAPARPATVNRPRPKIM